MRFDCLAGAGERWHALGMAGGVVVVVHTYPGDEEADRIRVVSARRATRSEWRAYEDGSDQ